MNCLLRNLYEGQEATVRTGHGTTDWFRLGKGYVKALYCHPACLTYMQGTSCKMLHWMKPQARLKIARKNNNLRYADDTTFMAKN